MGHPFIGSNVVIDIIVWLYTDIVDPVFGINFIYSYGQEKYVFAVWKVDGIHIRTVESSLGGFPENFHFVALTCKIEKTFVGACVVLIADNGHPGRAFQ